MLMIQRVVLCVVTCLLLQKNTFSETHGQC